MSDEPKFTAELLNNLWSRWLIIFAPILLVFTIGLTLFDHVAAGALMAGLFIVVTLLHYLPQMEIFKAFGVEVKFVARRAEEAVSTVAKLDQPIKELTARKDSLPAEVVPTIEKLNAAFTTANDKVTELAQANSALLDDFRTMYHRSYAAWRDPMATSGPEGPLTLRAMNKDDKSAE
jgi:hypothetical protein